MKTDVVRVCPQDQLWNDLAQYAQNCSWVAGGHLAMLMREDGFADWETPFAALLDGAIIGYCTVMQTDYYPENRYSPWISSVFVEERFRGRGVCGLLLRAAEQYLAQNGFEKAYIPSDMTGFYERYGYERIDSLVNYGGDTDNIFMKHIK